jgi:hypothetical protein
MGCSGQLQVAIRVVPKVYWDFQSLNYCKEIRGSGIGLTNTQRRAAAASHTVQPPEEA